MRRYRPADDAERAQSAASAPRLIVKDILAHRGTPRWLACHPEAWQCISALVGIGLERAEATAIAPSSAVAQNTSSPARRLSAGVNSFWISRHWPGSNSSISVFGMRHTIRLCYYAT